MCISLCNLLGALGVQYVAIALYQWFDWGTDILFLDAEIYGSEFREHPSFAATRTAAIFFDVTGFIALVWALRRKAIFQLRIRKAAREGKFKDDRQRERFEKMYVGGQTFLYTAFVLLLLEDIPEAVITVHVIQATPGGMSSIAWLAVITSCGGVVYAFGNWFCKYVLALRARRAGRSADSRLPLARAYSGDARSGASTAQRVRAAGPRARASRSTFR